MRGIILGCLQQNPGWQGPRGSTNPDWINLKRSGGAHKIASYMRSEGWDIEVLDYWLAFTDEEFKEFARSRITNDTRFVGVSVTFGYTGNILKIFNILPVYPKVTLTPTNLVSFVILERANSLNSSSVNANQ